MEAPIKLVLSGGGPKGIAILGALHYLHEQDQLSRIKEYWGTSIGSVLCVLLAIGYTPFEAFHFFFVNTGIIENGQHPAVSFQQLLGNPGLCPIEKFGDKVRAAIATKIAVADPTFKQFENATGRRLHVIGTNVTSGKLECFNAADTPDMPVSVAIEISCDLPIIFTKKVYNGNVYSDGGFVNNYPINMTDDGETPTLGVCVFGDNSNPKSELDLFLKLMHIPILELHRERTQNLSGKCVNMELTVNGIGFFEMSPSQNKKIKIFSMGYQQARNFYKRLVADSWAVEF